MQQFESLPNTSAPESPHSARLQEEAHTTPVMALHTLRLGEKADRSNIEFVSTDKQMARIYRENKEGIVRITAEEANGVALGTGFFVTEEGRVATDAHVIDGAKSITVESSDGQKYSAHVVPGKDKPTNDLVLLDLDNNVGKRFHALKLANSTSELKFGDSVFALGHPLGWKNTFISPGQFNTFETSPGRGFNPQLLNINSHVHVEPGNSGGPLFNNRGEVIGVTRTTFNSQDPTSKYFRNVVEDVPLQSNFTRVEELNALLGRNSSAQIQDYFEPKEFNWGADTIGLGAAFVASSAGAMRHRGLEAPARGGVLRGIALPILGANMLYNSDYPFLQAAIAKGSTAEIINGGINVAADAMIVAGAAMMIHPKLAPIAGTLELGGTGIKFANQLLANRRYD
ncbi:MAG TPA: trypsin-like peptidase domain-containing protein [Drouetiella sp.]|jgi:Trypsin-like peptidase domain